MQTGGKGLHNSGTGPDALFSQGAVKVGGNNLFVVNVSAQRAARAGAPHLR